MIYKDLLDMDELRRYAQNFNQRARERGIKGRVTAEILRDRILESGGVCGWCGGRIVGQPFEIDHIIPLSRGGANSTDNLATACPDCNRRKSGKHPARFTLELIAEGVEQTALMTRVLDYYKVEAPTRQLSLFDDDPDVDAPESATGDDSEPPPYKWT